MMSLRRLVLTCRQRLPLVAAALLPLLAASCDSDSGAKNLDLLAPSEHARPSAAAPTARAVSVRVTGAVRKPGVYTLAHDANIAEAIVAAGGVTEQGTLDRLTLTATVKNNATVFVPALPLPEAARTAPSPPVPAVPAVPVVTAIEPAPVALPPALVTVTVKGAVLKPGTFHLPPGARVASALMAAGGPTASANLAGIGLNQPLREGMTLTVPIANHTPTPGFTVPPPAPPLDINSATAEQLQQLPGIGSALAARIVAYRKEVGAFRTPEQLLDVKGISPETFGRIQSLVQTRQTH